MTPRLATVWCPNWPTVAARLPADEPAAVFRANRVIARTPAAEAAGVLAGQRRRAAQGVCPELGIIEHDPDRDAREFEPLVRAVADMAPRLEVVEPGWLSLASRGPSRYFGGERPTAERLAALVIDTTVANLGVSARVGVGVADGRSASAIAARRAGRLRDRVVVVPPGGSPAFVDQLSIGWLRELGEITPELVDLFARLGLRTLGQLAALDVGDVLGRFGVDGLHAHRLASGADARPSAATDPPPEWSVEHPFAEPVEQLDTVVFVAKRLADRLTGELSATGRVCVRLVVQVETDHGERCERAWYRNQGLSSPAMVERVRWQLEGWARQPGGLSGGVALVRLVPDEVRGDDGVQAGLWGGRSQADHDAARAIGRLSGLAGEQAVNVPMWRGGRLPGERYELVPAAASDLEDADDRLDRGDGPWPGSSHGPSPSVVYEQPVEVLDEHGESVRVGGRGDVSGAPVTLVAGSRRHRVVAWAGPWPVEQRWWAGGRARRLARFQLVTDEGVAHLVGVEQGRWSILATYA
ncbi:MAG: DNA polymerase Y family protein [Ilumatobacter sp.]|uniref:DNA polymerase Y family protein n=1 Tax=Ilumatobacter sp. TaxID=1967498 RepID=UPI00262F6D20|nr:DNA polymerase Y family protein [Ilumatobacter sp.]MDJ0771417.1 DNA polymerase Y family protein [Ilumatobacter sp.]